MEPMTLGSAPSSPSSPTSHPNYLPSFLLGESQPQSSTPKHPQQQQQYSPGRNATPSYQVGTPGVSTTGRRSLSQKLFAPRDQDITFQSPYVSKTERPGPPKQGLFDSVGREKNEVTMEVNCVNESGFGINTSLKSPLQDTSCRNENIYGGDSLWVTVFGFSPQYLSAILGHFSNLGALIEKKHPAQGNWVHIKYSSYEDVGKALQFNGKVVIPGVMVGVIPYSPNKDGVSGSPDKGLNLSRARSLRRSVIVPSNMDSSIVSPQNMPQRSTGLVTKAMEYVFGW